MGHTRLWIWRRRCLWLPSVFRIPWGLWQPIQWRFLRQHQWEQWRWRQRLHSPKTPTQLWRLLWLHRQYRWWNRGFRQCGLRRWRLSQAQCHHKTRIGPGWRKQFKGQSPLKVRIAKHHFTACWRFQPRRQLWSTEPHRRAGNQAFDAFQPVQPEFKSEFGPIWRWV